MFSYWVVCSTLNNWKLNVQIAFLQDCQHCLVHCVIIRAEWQLIIWWDVMLINLFLKTCLERVLCLILTSRCYNWWEEGHYPAWNKMDVGMLVMVIWLELDADDLHMSYSVCCHHYQLCHLLLQQNSDWIDSLVLAYLGCPRNWTLNKCTAVWRSAQGRILHQPRTGSGVVRIDPLQFLAGCHTRRLNPVWFLFYILACLLLCWCLLGPLFMYC